MRKTADGRRLFSRDFKIAAVRRVLGGEELGKVARELEIAFELLLRWRNRVTHEGEGGLHDIGARRGRKTPSTDEGLKKRVADLERLVGRQKLEISFLDKALRQVEESRSKTNDDGVTASSK